MRVNDKFRHLIDFLDSYSTSITLVGEHFVCIADQGVFDELSSLLSDAGYVDEPRPDKEGVIFSLSFGQWDELPPIYTDEEQFWRSVSTGQSVPQNCFIISTLQARVDGEAKGVFTKAELFLKVRQLMIDIADHYNKAENKALLFVGSDDRASKVEITLSLSFNEFSCLDCSEEMPGVFEFAATINLNDVHKGERREVLRRAIVNLLDEPHGSSSDFLWILSNVDKLKIKYQEQYELYFRNFSVSKLLNEIDQKTLEFTAKLSEFISSSQNKAIAIPGVLVAIGSLVKAGSGLGVVLIVLGVLVVNRIVVVSNSMMRDTFDDIEWQVKTSFKKYESIKDNEEVTSLARQCSAKITDKIVKARSRLKQVDWLAHITLLVTILYALALLTWGGDAASKLKDIVLGVFYALFYFNCS